MGNGSELLYIVYILFIVVNYERNTFDDYKTKAMNNNRANGG